MNIKERLLLLLVLPFSLFGLQKEPWLGEIWEFNFVPSYTFDFYPRVEGGIPHHQKTTIENILQTNLYVSPFENWQIEAELEFAETSRVSMGYRSLSLQLRNQLLAESIGDSYSLTWGGYVRAVSSRDLQDVSCPYHAHCNIELGGSLGKEWEYSSFWNVLGYGYVGVGTANRGYPWLYFLASLQAKSEGSSWFELFLQSYLGWGDKNKIFINIIKKYGIKLFCFINKFHDLLPNNLYTFGFEAAGEA
mgnify:CR=1 FL=1